MNSLLCKSIFESGSRRLSHAAMELISFAMLVPKEAAQKDPDVYAVWEAGDFLDFRYNPPTYTLVKNTLREAQKSEVFLCNQINAAVADWNAETGEVYKDLISKVLQDGCCQTLWEELLPVLRPNGAETLVKYKLHPTTLTADAEQALSYLQSCILVPRRAAALCNEMLAIWRLGSGLFADAITIPGDVLQEACEAEKYLCSKEGKLKFRSWNAQPSYVQLMEDILRVRACDRIATLCIADKER